MHGHALKVVAENFSATMFSAWHCVPSQGWLPRKWPSIKPLRIFAPTIGQQGGTWQVFRASSASCSGQVQASESTTEIMNVFFHFRNMHSKCSFMVTVSTFKCIFSNIVGFMPRQNAFFHFQKCIPNALSWWLFPHSNAFSQILSGLCLGKMHFFTSRNAFQMLFHGGCFHIQMHFSQILSGLCLGKMHFFTSRNAFQMLFHGGCFHIQMHFFKYCLVYASTQMYFFHFRKSISNAHSWRLLPHSYEILFRNVRLHTSVHARVRALARTEQLLQIFF